MNNNNNIFYLNDISSIKGVGSKIKKYLKKKNRKSKRSIV